MGKVLLRANAYDHVALARTFLRQDYLLEASGVRRILDLGPISAWPPYT
jgi:hypothetical protein